MMRGKFVVFAGCFGSKSAMVLDGVNWRSHFLMTLATEGEYATDLLLLTKVNHLHCYRF
jgi:hypothetical protein